MPLRGPDTPLTRISKWEHNIAHFDVHQAVTEKYRIFVVFPIGESAKPKHLVKN
ncbi:uncharacterized protein METZ01_LOCUS277603 [marine metagenome]|uniref:Uncharacterized protein n=1 Tax=marine metagenome TaxID=408172 RepID=A0A382KKI3_9ZZZZ